MPRTLEDSSRLLAAAARAIARRFHTRAWLALVVVLASAFVPRAAGAQSLPGGTAVIEWEAPGDDGWSGRAARYELRYRATPVLGADTLVWWNAGTVVPGLPLPGEPGATDSVVVADLNPSLTYYFMLRVGDEVPNWSAFSNVVVKPAWPDGIPPAVIRDLEALPAALVSSPPPGVASASDPDAAPPR
jgi:hypothetical protein